MFALIPARQGSKGLPQKNILDFCGRPLIEHTIQAALDSGVFDRVLVSTDSEKIAEIARKAGADVPFLRPQALASDQSLARNVYLHALDFYEKNWQKNLSFCALLPTSPLRSSDDIHKAHQIFLQKKAQSVISMTEALKPPEWCKIINETGLISSPAFSKELSEENRQKSQKYFIPNGSIYFFDREFFKNSPSYYGERTFGYLMPPERSIDIDSAFDFEIAQYLMKKNICP